MHTLVILLLVGFLGGGVVSGSSPTQSRVAGAVWPLAPPTVVEPFDPPPQRWLAGHRGVDLAATVGQPVRSPIGGRISFSGVVVDRPIVVISVGDRQVSLEPVESVLALGSVVAPGDVVGSVASAGAHCGSRACLHWGLRVAGEYRDPLLLVHDYRPVLIPGP